VTYTIEKIREIAPGLEKPFQKASFAANQHGLDGERAAVYLVLDRSGSMDWPGRGYYSGGAVQYFAERILGMAPLFEDDGRVPVVFFDHELKGMDELSLEDYQGKIAKAHSKLGHMGGTDYAVAMDAVVQHYQSTGKSVPALVIFQTDGSPRDKKAAARRICQYANLPIFWQFVGFGEDREYDYDDEEGLGFLQRLDDIPVPQYRPIDNSDFFAVGQDPTAMRDAELYRRLMNEFPGWLAKARQMGIVRV
jgi:hypothetical protein